MYKRVCFVVPPAWYWDPQGQYIQDEEPSSKQTAFLDTAKTERIPQTTVLTVAIELKVLWRAVLIFMNLKPLFISTSLPSCMYVVAKYFIFLLFICCLFLHTHCTALVVHHSDFWPGQPGKGITNISYYASLPSTLIVQLWLFVSVRLLPSVGTPTACCYTP